VSYAHPVAHLGHTVSVSFRNGTLMVTQHSNLSISSVIGRELLNDRGVCRRVLVELVLKGDRGVIGTEHLRRETLHVRLKVLVEAARL
jgi:hypothetical protein